MNTRVLRDWPVLVTVAILWCWVTLLLVQSIHRNDGRFIYATDDVYIGMAMAKNFAAHGIWGVSPLGGFTSTSSSPLWTLVMSIVFWIFGTNVITPLLFTVTCATVLLVVIDRIMARLLPSLPAVYRFLVLLSVMVMTPIPTMIFIGMEHLLHMLVLIPAVYYCARQVADEGPEERSAARLLMLAPFLIIIRYEDIFVVLLMSLLLAVRKKTRYAFVFLAAALAPPFVTGLISVSHGWHWVPNPVLLKGDAPHFDSLRSTLEFFSFQYGRLFTENLQLLVPLIAALVIFAHRLRKGWTTTQIMLGMTIAVTLFHMRLARIDSFHRYEAYLLALFVLVIAAAAAEYFGSENKRTWKGSIPAGIAVVSILFVSATHGLKSHNTIVPATHNIYEQQYQMGLFIGRYFSGRTVALNDIGAPSYLADFRLFDLVGLGTLAVSDAWLNDCYTVRELDTLSRNDNVDIAIMYDRWILAKPSSWVKVGVWRIPDNAVCGDDTVSFYAVNPAAKEYLIAKLKEFSPHLPENVRWRVASR